MYTTWNDVRAIRPPFCMVQQSHCTTWTLTIEICHAPQMHNGSHYVYCLCDTFCNFHTYTRKITYKRNHSKRPRGVPHTRSRTSDLTPTLWERLREVALTPKKRNREKNRPWSSNTLGIYTTVMKLVLMQSTRGQFYRALETIHV